MFRRNLAAIGDLTVGATDCPKMGRGGAKAAGLNPSYPASRRRHRLNTRPAAFTIVASGIR
jgi:hypothetical protein